MNPRDHVRTQILQFFYDRNERATSQYGKKGSAVKISDVRKALKELHGLKQHQVVSNLTYLIDKGWINKTDIEKTVRTKGGTVPSTVTWYEISAAGIDRIEGGSSFEENQRFPGINISATGGSIITLGDGNIVNAAHRDLHDALDGLMTALTASVALDDSQKLDAAADLETIKDQLIRREPDKTIISRLWSRIEEVSVVGGFMDAVSRVAPMVQALIP